MLMRIIRALESEHLKNNEATGQLNVNIWLVVLVSDRYLKVRQFFCGIRMCCKNSNH